MSNFSTPERPRILIQVQDMTSQSAADTVMSALMRLDDRATVRIDLPTQRVEITPKSAEPSAFMDAIRKAGYSTVRAWPADLAYLWA